MTGAPDTRTTFAKLTDAFVEVVLPLARGGGERIVASEAADGLRIERVARGKASPYRPRRGRPPRCEVELRLEPHKVLQRTVRLPAAGREYFAAILEHRLDRLTPWRPDQVVFGFAAGSAAAADGHLDVEFAATSAALAAEAEARLAAAGLTATRLGAATAPAAAPLAVDLWRGARDPTRRGVRRQVVRWGMVAVVVLAPLCAGSFWLVGTREAALAEADARYAAARRELMIAAGAGSERERAEALLAAKTPERAAVVLVDRIAAVLPDDTFLRRLELAGDDVRLAGVSANAAGLIGRLSNVLEGVSFAAPVVRDEAGRDTFEVVGRRRAAGEPESAGQQASAAGGE